MTCVIAMKVLIILVLKRTVLLTILSITDLVGIRFTIERITTKLKSLSIDYLVSWSSKIGFLKNLDKG